MFIGQPLESASTEQLQMLETEAERENVQIYALALPIVGTAFLSDSFSPQGFGSQSYKGGWESSVELTHAVPALRRLEQASSHTDVFSLLTVATGGIQLHFRNQKHLENAIIGSVMRCAADIS